ncbi:MAG TPA: NfeD family protein [Actinomycetota bacterium]|nr:NfeD family protein [Actinomycetota bacterium]
MRRVVSFSLVVAAVFVVFAGTAAAQSAPSATVEVIKVEGPLDAPLVGFVHERLDAAAADGTIVVLQLDTPGTMGEGGVALADKIASMPVPVIAWVGPVPAEASGAGLLLLHASSLAAVAPGSQTGPLTPIDLLAPDERPADLEAEIASWVDARGHGTDLSYPDEPMTAQQAVDGYGIARYSASSVIELLRTIDGVEVPTSEGPVTLRTRVAANDAEAAQSTVDLRFNEPGPLKRVQHAVATPSMVYWLLVAALAALAFELTQPGFGFAGFSGIVLGGLGLYGLVQVPPTWLGFAVFLLGTALLVLDVRLRRLGVLTAAGLVLFGVGSWWSWSYVAEPIRISPWLIGGAVVAAFLYYGFGLTVAIQSHDRIVSTQRGLIGLVGEATGRLAPDGPVEVKGATWRGRSTGDPIDAGTKVRVRGVDGLVLRVEADAPEPDPERV